MLSCGNATARSPRSPTNTNDIRMNNSGELPDSAKKNSDRKELERRLKQAQRMAKEQNDPLTMERLAELVRELEEQLR